jgi:hypothetical protein
MFPQFGKGLRLSDVADAVIYRGPEGNPLLEASPAYKADEAYATELQRRARIATPPKPKPLGRVAGPREDRLKRLAWDGPVDEIIEDANPR